jgi:hypothetical protein
LARSKVACVLIVRYPPVLVLFIGNVVAGNGGHPWKRNEGMEEMVMTVVGEVEWRAIFNADPETQSASQQTRRRYPGSRRGSEKLDVRTPTTASLFKTMAK